MKAGVRGAVLGRNAYVYRCFTDYDIRLKPGIIKKKVTRHLLNSTLQNSGSDNLLLCFAAWGKSVIFPLRKY
jgi:hypothetical protein